MDIPFTATDLFTLDPDLDCGEIGVIFYDDSDARSLNSLIFSSDERTKFTILDQDSQTGISREINYEVKILEYFIYHSEEYPKHAFYEEELSPPAFVVEIADPPIDCDGHLAATAYAVPLAPVCPDLSGPTYEPPLPNSGRLDWLDDITDFTVDRGKTFDEGNVNLLVSFNGGDCEGVDASLDNSSPPVCQFAAFGANMENWLFPTNDNGLRFGDGINGNVIPPTSVGQWVLTYSVEYYSPADCPSDVGQRCIDYKYIVVDVIDTLLSPMPFSSFDGLILDSIPVKIESSESIKPFIMDVDEASVVSIAFSSPLASTQSQLAEPSQIAIRKRKL